MGELPIPGKAIIRGGVRWLCNFLGGFGGFAGWCVRMPIIRSAGVCAPELCQNYSPECGACVSLCRREMEAVWE